MNTTESRVARHTVAAPGSFLMRPARQQSEMPLYEYTCQNTGLTIELIRPMTDADK